MIEVENLKKSYKGKQVLNGVSFKVGKGEAFGLLGVNGAGKTTTLECIEGMREPDSGRIHVRGIIGIQLQEASLPEMMTAKEAMQLICAWRGAPARLDLLEKFGVGGDWMNKTYSQLSLGMRKRLHIALALCHNPDIIILDEPTAGLDVEGRDALHKEIQALSQSGASVLLSTHDMAEAEKLCHRVAILNNGKIAREGTPLELTANKQNSVFAKTRASSLDSYPGALGPAKDGYTSYLCQNAAEFLLPLLRHIQESGDEVLDLRVGRATIEDIFLEVAKEGGKM